MASLRQRKKNAAQAAERKQRKLLQEQKQQEQRRKEQQQREAGRQYAERKKQEQLAKQQAAALNTRKKAYNKDKAKEARINRQNTKFQALKMLGLSDAEAKKLSRGKGELSFPEIEKLAAKKSRQRKKIPAGGKVYTAKQYLTVMWITFSGYGNFMSGHDVITSWNMMDKQAQAAQTYANSSETDDDSSGARGDFLHKIGPKDVCEAFLNSKANAVNRKNRKAIRSGDHLNKQYEVVLAPTNKFTVNGMLDLLNTVMDKVVPYRARHFYEMIQDYTREYLPKEFYDELF